MQMDDVTQQWRQELQLHEIKLMTIYLLTYDTCAIPISTGKQISLKLKANQTPVA